MSQLKNANKEDTELRRFLDSLTDWVWEMDVHGIHTYSNSAVKIILGYEADELIGRHVSMFWPTELASPEKIDLFNKELKDGEAWQHYRGSFRHKNGDVKILESSGEPLYDTDGILIGFRGMDRDIEITLQHEKELEESKEEYRVLSEKFEWENNFKALLLDIINHDIMNPVNVICGLSDLLKRKLPDNDMIGVVNTSSLRLVEVISNARALTQISMTEPINLNELNLSDIIHSTLGEFEKLFIGSGIKLQISIPEEMTILANPVISEVFTNYFANVLKYSGKGRLVIVTARNIDDSILVEVKDEGETLPENMRLKVFERGVQLDESRSGSGMGLAIVQRIAKAHQAEVGVRPRAIQGNSFYIRFPKRT